MTSPDPLALRLAPIVGGKTAKAFEAMDVLTVGDLLRHYPRRYIERGELTDLALLREGEHVTVMARIESVTTKPLRQRKGSMLEVMITDGRRRLRVTFSAAHTDDEVAVLLDALAQIGVLP